MKRPTGQTRHVSFLPTSVTLYFPGLQPAHSVDPVDFAVKHAKHALSRPSMGLYVKTGHSLQSSAPSWAETVFLSSRFFPGGHFKHDSCAVVLEN